MIDESVKRKLKILSFFEKYGLKPTTPAFGISKSTIYRWRKILRDDNGRIEVLKDKSRAPKYSSITRSIHILVRRGRGRLRRS